MSWLGPVTGFLLAGVATAALLPFAIRLGHLWGVLDMPGKHKRHDRPTPVMGGPVLFVAVWSAVGLAAVLFPDEMTVIRPTLMYIAAGSLIVSLVGLSDDLRPVSAWTKLLSQVAAGTVLYLGGLGIDPITIPFMGAFELGHWSLAITIGWVVLLTNAINLIDGLDGLAGGVSLIAAVVLLAVGRMYAVESVAVFASGLIGFLLVFLYYNRPPARVFLGDSGSLQLGFYFAVISLVVPIRSFTAAALYVPLLALGLPLLETAAAFVRRTMAGRPVMKADRRHFFHLLALTGLSPLRTVLVFYILSAVFGAFALAMVYLNRRIVTGFLVLFMVVILVLFFILRSNLLRRYRSRRQFSDAD
jgi:UDP-GlcNAc:undecaprenyl-phosphate GlcNAc-1-phosphate transferase